ncbi:MAG: hypothetical protein HQL98_14930, partial [Magnetococcales bacterium]|nr:hypothetical protein [Magnetococcales bacterium]
VNDPLTGTVTLAGTATQGQTLTASHTLADLDGLGTVNYQWQADGTAISGATGSTFVLTESQVGKVMTVTARYTDGHGSAESLTSSGTGRVANLNDAPTGSVTLAGTATQGQTLTAFNTLADGDGLGTVSYQWQADGTAITGATGVTFVLTESQVGKVVTVTARYTDGHGTAESLTSSATTAVANINDIPTGSVTIAGTATQGQTLTASDTLADDDGLGRVRYQWNADGVAIEEATDPTFVLTETQVGKVITVTARYTDGHGTAESVTSSATTGVTNSNDSPTGSVTIVGTATQGQTLTASHTLEDGDGLGSVGYQWNADGVAIEEATSSTFVLTETQVGKAITVTARYTDGHGTGESVTSDATDAVANVNDAPTGSVTITGTATQGQTLTASHNLADQDGLGTVRYQWQADGAAIEEATGTTFILTESQVGQAITVTAHYSDGHGTSESIASDATETVANVNDDPTGTLIITGTATQGQTLTVSSTLADEDGLGTVHYQWNADGVAIEEATETTFILTESQVGQAITVTASYSDGHGMAERVTSSATDSVANVNDAPTGSVTISGTATQGQTLTVSHTLADEDGLGTISYQWQADGVAIEEATGTTFLLTESQVGQAITVTAHYTDGHGTAESIASIATDAVANVNDVPTGSVTIAGTSATQGQTLTASNTLADGDGLGTVRYQWNADGVAIEEATGTTFILTESQVGRAITVTASYSDGHGTAESVTSSATGAVLNVNDAPTGSVTITGTATQGQTLTASNTLADGDGLGTVRYQWNAGGVAIEEATGTTLVLTESQVGKTITVTARYTDSHGTAESLTSIATESVANVNDAPTGSVTITGTATQGQTLTASHTLADVDGLGTVSYQWKADGTAITDATNTTLVLTESQVGKAITVTARYTDGHGTAESVTSSATGSVVNVNDAPTGSVTISGTATQGQTLTASHTLADGDGLGTVSYQWKAAGTAIAGATGSTLVLAEAQVGKAITVTASYSDGHGTAESVTSSATGSVANVNDPLTGSVTISGTVTQGQTLTASHTLTDADGLGTVSYQWKAAGTAIAGATGSTLVLAEAQVGKAITVTASYTDGHGTAESTTSSATASVANLNDAPTGSVLISGNPYVGYTLSASNTLSDADGMNTVSYQWKANGTNIGTGSSFVLTSSQSGKTVTVTASYTDGHGTAESVVSSATASVGTEIQGNTSTAASIKVGSSVTGTVDSGGDSDWFLVALQSGSTYRFDLEGQPTGKGTISDSYFYFYNSSGGQLGFDDDSGDGLNSRLSYTASYTGNYYASAAGYGSSSGTYTLTVTCVSGDPLVLDLDHNGVQLTSREQGVAFDMNADGLSDQTGWIAPGDGLLVMDVNGDGRIDGIGELVSEYLVPGADSSLHALSTLDGNRDGQVDGLDEGFSRLQVWLDGDQNGVSSAGELHALGELGIVSLGVSGSRPEVTQLQGNQVTANATFQTVDGEKGTMAEVVFSFFDSREVASSGSASTGSDVSIEPAPKESGVWIAPLPQGVTPVESRVDVTPVEAPKEVNFGALILGETGAVHGGEGDGAQVGVAAFVPDHGENPRTDWRVDSEHPDDPGHHPVWPDPMADHSTVQTAHG